MFPEAKKSDADKNPVCLACHHITLPLIPLLIASLEWKKLERFHRVFVRACLSVPRFSAKTAMLVKVQDCSLELQAKAKIIEHLTRLHHDGSTAQFLNCFMLRPSSRVGHLTTKFLEVRAPSSLPPPFAPPTPRSPHDVQLPIPKSGKQSGCATAVRKTTRCRPLLHSISGVPISIYRRHCT